MFQLHMKESGSHGTGYKPGDEKRRDYQYRRRKRQREDHGDPGSAGLSSRGRTRKQRRYPV